MQAFFGFIVIVVFVGSVYYGATYFIKKGFQSTPKQETTNYRNDRQIQSQQAEDLKQRQRDLKRQQQDRMRDMQRR